VRKPLLKICFFFCPPPGDNWGWGEQIKGVKRGGGGGARGERGTEEKCLHGSDGDTATENVT